MNNYNIWEILSSVGTLAAVVVALSLSILPSIFRIIQDKNNATKKLIHIYRIVYDFFDEYRFFYTSHTIISKKVYRKYEPDKIRIQLNIYKIIEPLLDDINKSNYKYKDQLLDIYYLSLKVFSGWDVAIIDWYKLESRIGNLFNFPKNQKRYFKYTKINEKNEEDYIYNCICCSGGHKKSDKLEQSELNLDEKEIFNFFKTEFCKKHRIPMHLTYKGND